MNRNRVFSLFVGVLVYAALSLAGASKDGEQGRRVALALKEITETKGFTELVRTCAAGDSPAPRSLTLNSAVWEFRCGEKSSPRMVDVPEAQEALKRHGLSLVGAASGAGGGLRLIDLETKAEISDHAVSIGFRQMKASFLNGMKAKKTLDEMQRSLVKEGGDKPKQDAPIAAASPKGAAAHEEPLSSQARREHNDRLNREGGKPGDFRYNNNGDKIFY